MRDQAGELLTGGLVRAKVHHENSYYDYEVTVPLNNSTENLLYVELPPIRTPAAITLTAYNAGGTSESFTVSNDTYWPKVAASTNGHADGHTFTIRYRSYLPMIVR